MIFSLMGGYAGRWVCNAIYDSNTWVEKLKFSADGRLLLALLRSSSSTAKSGYQSKALIYSSENIPKENLARQSPVIISPEEAPSLQWDWEYDEPIAVAFAGDGMTVAVATTHNAEGVAKIRMFKNVLTEWNYLGAEPVQMFDSVGRYGKGITSLSLFFPFQLEANCFATIRILHCRLIQLIERQ